MEYQFRTNKPCDKLSSDLSSVLLKNRRTAFNSAWKRKDGVAFYGTVKNNHFIIKQYTDNNKIIYPCFTGNIVENGNETLIIGRFNFYFMINYCISFPFLSVAFFCFFMIWSHNIFFSSVLTLIGLIIYLLPMEYIRKKEEQKILTLIKEVI